MHTVVLPVAANLYAVPIDWVREVVATPTVTRLVTAPPIVLGLINLRGEIVPLLDTAALLGVGTIETIPFAVVLHTEHGSVALAVTGFPQRADLGSPVARSELPGTVGSYRLEQRVAVLLDLAALLTPAGLGGHDFRAIASAVGVS